MSERKRITILGSTGSIGTQALEVIDAYPDLFVLNYITTYSNIDLLEAQCRKYNPKGVVICHENAYNKFLAQTAFKGEILNNDIGLIEAASHPDNDLVLVALIGFAGVQPTISAIESGIDVALANKEVLVSAGEIITELAKQHNVTIYPIDSEHSAISQCLNGENKSTVEKLIITASGGPFLHTPKEQLQQMTAKDALKHPVWAMGNKITIDSATMMNKGFEVIEAHWLFGIKLNKIDVVVHPQSIIHSMVQFVDGAVIAQLGCPDMKIPIAYALNYPNRLKTNFPRLDFNSLKKLEFVEPDTDKFKCLTIAYEALEKGGNLPAIVNAANEIAVSAFINNFISFLDIPECIIKALIKIPFISNPTIYDIIQTNVETRNFVASYTIKNNNIIN